MRRVLTVEFEGEDGITFDTKTGESRDGFYSTTGIVDELTKDSGDRVSGQVDEVVERQELCCEGEERDWVLW